jgi:hypothetical protein
MQCAVAIAFDRELRQAFDLGPSRRAFRWNGARHPRCVRGYPRRKISVREC